VIGPPHYGRREEVLSKMLTVVVSAAIMVAMLAMSGVALAKGGADVCVSNKGETKVDKGDSSCFSDSTSHAVATKDSNAVAVEDSKAQAHNNSNAAAVDGAHATAVNCGNAAAIGDGNHAKSNGHGGC
jgi:hypothetical protein